MRNREGKRRPDPERRAAANIARMAAHQGLHIGQPHAFARHVLLADAAKRLKDFGNIRCRNAAAVVLHMERRVRRTALRRDDHLARATRLADS